MAPDETDAPADPDLGAGTGRSRLRRASTALLPGLVILGLLAYGFIRPARETPEDAPSFELPLLSGGTLADEDLRGQPIVLNFWASWCGPCREEMPAFQRLWQRYRDEGLMIVGVNIRDSRIGARGFVDELGVTYPNVYDGRGELARKLDVYGLPQTVFITSDYEFLVGSTPAPSGPAIGPTGPGGTVVLGAISEEDLEERIRELLAD